MTPTPARLLLAYITVYLVWGSSYLFMKFAVASLPPLPLAGARYFIAGVILCIAVFALWRVKGTRAEWGAAAMAGTALMGSNAAVAWSVKRIPSGVAALLVGMTPCWMILMEWLRDRDQRPHGRVVAGLALGLLGIGILVGPTELFGGSHIDPLGAAAALGGTGAWSAGSLYSRRAPRRASAQLRIVDTLKMVQVQHHEGKRLPKFLGARRSLRQERAQHGTRYYPGKRIPVGNVLQFGPCAEWVSHPGLYCAPG